MRFFLSKKHDPSPPPDPSPQQLFSQAELDKDYSKRACLRTYSSRTIILTGTEAGEEKSEPPTPAEEKGKGGEAGVSRPKHWWNRFAVWRGPKTKSPGPRADTPASTPAYITGGITWVQPGLWKGKKAHFVLLNFQQRRGEEHYLERVELDLRVWRAGDALKSIAEHSHEPLADVLPPLAESLADHAPPIVLYAPRAVVGRPAASHIEPYWEGSFRPGETIRYGGDLHSPRELTIDGPKPNDARCLLHVVAYGDLEHEVPAPNFSVALVVLSDGKPFDLTAYDVTFHWDLEPIRHYLWSPYLPARFSEHAQLIPKGHKPLHYDFASEEMKAKIKELLQWCAPFDTVSQFGFTESTVADAEIWFGNERGCADRLPQDTRGCSRRACELCRGRC